MFVQRSGLGGFEVGTQLRVLAQQFLYERGQIRDLFCDRKNICLFRREVMSDLDLKMLLNLPLPGTRFSGAC